MNEQAVSCKNVVFLHGYMITLIHTLDWDRCYFHLALNPSDHIVGINFKLRRVVDV